jgi:hypothetical protein
VRVVKDRRCCSVVLDGLMADFTRGQPAQTVCPGQRVGVEARFDTRFRVQVAVGAMAHWSIDAPLCLWTDKEKDR